jgi:hypothetical protein
MTSRLALVISTALLLISLSIICRDSSTTLVEDTTSYVSVLIMSEEVEEVASSFFAVPFAFDTAPFL